MDNVHEEITKIPDEFKELAIGKNCLGLPSFR